MRSHPYRIFLSRIAVLAVLLPSAAAAQEKGYPFRLSNFKFEFYGGTTTLPPAELDLIADYEEAYLRFFYLDRYETLASKGYAVSFERTGDGSFRPLRRGTPWGFRLKYELSPTLALALGLQCLDASRTSSVGLLATVRDPSGNTFTDRYDNPGFGLSVRAWLPQLSATFGWDLGRLLRYEIFVAGGPMVVETEAATDVRLEFADGGGFRSEFSERRVMKGRTKSWHGELGVILRLRPARFFDLFGEAGYAFREASAFTGPATSRTRTFETTGGETLAELDVDGSWLITEVSAVKSWGTFAASKVVVADWNVRPRPTGFKLQFSGFQLKGGLGIRL